MNWKGKLSKLELIDARNIFYYVDKVLNDFKQEQKHSLIKLDPIDGYIKDFVIYGNDEMSYILGPGWTTKTPGELKYELDHIKENQRFLDENYAICIGYDELDNSLMMDILKDFYEYSNELWSVGLHFTLTDPRVDKNSVMQRLQKVVNNYLKGIPWHFKDHDRSKEYTQWIKKSNKTIFISCGIEDLVKQLDKLETNNDFKLDKNSSFLVEQVLSTKLLLMNNLYNIQYNYVNNEKHYSLEIEQLFVDSFEHVIRIVLNSDIVKDFVAWKNSVINDTEYIQKNMYINGFINKIFICFFAYREDFCKQLTRAKFNTEGLKPSYSKEILTENEIQFISDRYKQIEYPNDKLDTFEFKQN